MRSAHGDLKSAECLQLEQRLKSALDGNDSLTQEAADLRTKAEEGEKKHAAAKAEIEALRNKEMSLKEKIQEQSSAEQELKQAMALLTEELASEKERANALLEEKSRLEEFVDSSETDAKSVAIDMQKQRYAVNE